MSIFSSLKIALGLDQKGKALIKYAAIADKIDSLEESVKKLSDAELKESANFFHNRLENDEGLNDILPEVFARVREVSVRTIGLRHFREQLIGGMALNDGYISEMKTGEGKTLVATLAVALNAMTRKGVHVITVNDYLAGRDASWMSPVYEGLGLSVGVIVPFMEDAERRAQYNCDITYGTNSEFGFDYLRDNMAVSKLQQVQRGHNFCIVDEVDSILIDEARTPLIISGPSEDDTASYVEADTIARKLVKDRDFDVDEKDRNLALTETGIKAAEVISGKEDLFTDFKNSSLTHKITQALKAHHLFVRDVHYVVKNREIIIVDEFTGRLMEGRRYSDGLHQAIEAKERVQIGRENQTLATITLQNYFRMYKKLAGMTGTALTEEAEFKEIYGMGVLAIPTHKPMIRKDNPDVVYKTAKEKYIAVADEVAEVHKTGQPILIGTASIEHSEKVSKLLRARGVPHNVLNAKVHEKEATIVAQAGRLGAVTVATNMAGRGTDIMLGGNPKILADTDLAKEDKTRESAPDEYKSLLEKYTLICSDEHDKVLAAGGLRIIGTERHESRRIDNQLRGRSGRQGDPGESRFYLALEDDLIRLFGGDRIASIMDRLGIQEGEAIEHQFLSRAIEGAQKKVEQMHFDIRKQLLAFDNVMNKQREAIYAEREAILTDPKIEERMKDILQDTASECLNAIFDNLPSGEVPDFKAAKVRLASLYWPSLGEMLNGLETKEELDAAREKIASAITDRYEQKVLELGIDNARGIFRYIFLEVLDKFWKEHLLAMDELRRSIGLRAIGQKDPLTEYQFESFNLFQEMLVQIRTSITEFAWRVSVINEDTGRRNRGNATHDEFVSDLANRKNPGAVATAEKTAPIVNGPKIGRNDPCPCGSGKKYKQCCGKNK